jgi:type VI secretion system protein ImpG
LFNKYYQDELAYLRDLGREFADAYPALAPMLADSGGDPDVERLLEGVAFLTGRIRQKLDDELPEVVLAIAELLFPQLVRPLPGAAILELKPLPNVLRERRLLKRGAEFSSVPVDGTPCRFRSSYDVEMVPWTVKNVRLELLPAAREQLCIDIEVPPGLDFSEGSPERLRLHFAGDPRTAFGLLLWIHQHAEEVVLTEPRSPPGQKREVSLGKQALRAVGFEDDEALVPFARTAFPGFRYLTEYNVLPAKFAFVDVMDTKRAAELGAKITEFTLAIRFDSQLPPLPEVNKDSVKLHCTPVVNVFDTTAEPIRLEATREQYLVRPAGLPRAHGSVYAIKSVEAVLRGGSERYPVPSFFEFTDTSSRGAAGRIFYTTHLRPGVVGDSSDMTLSVGTAEASGVQPQADLLSIDLLATNQRAANAVRAGEIRVPTASSPPYATFGNLGSVTTYVPPLVGRELLWRVIAHAAMNLRSLTDPEVLKAMLRVYNLHGQVDRQAARANQLRVDSIKDVSVQGIERLYRGAPVRGVAIDVTCDESGFAGEGDLFLFGMLLDRLFASYVSINSFARTTINSLQSKARYAWPPRSGNLTLL